MSRAASPTSPGKQAHFMLMGKGGIGKTLISSLLSQYLMEQKYHVCCIDTDPVNASLSQIRALNTKHTPICWTDNGEVDYFALAESFNDLFKHPACYVFDSGASSYQPMHEFLLTMGGLHILKDNHYPTFLHTIVATGSELLQTMEEAAATIDAVKGTIPTILWINERNGTFERQMQAPIEQTQFYKDLGAYISGIIVVTHMNMFDRRLFEMLLLKKKLFHEILNAQEGLFIMQQSRLQWIKNHLFANISQGLSGMTHHD